MDIDRYVEEKKGLINRTLETLVPLGDNPVERAIRYSLIDDKASRWRPILSLIIGESFGDNYPALPRISCAAELVHTLSLIVDDLPCMDNAKMRRGRKTCHLVYGQAFTTLAALWLQEQAHSVIATCPLPPRHKDYLYNISAKTMQKMISGQASDLENNIGITFEGILKRYSEKTGELSAFAALVGGLGARDLRNEDLMDFGRNIGIAYQIIDDINDAECDSEITGKDAKVDEKRKLITAVTRLGVDDARKKAREFRDKSLEFAKGKHLLEDFVRKLIDV